MDPTPKFNRGQEVMLKRDTAFYGLVSRTLPKGTIIKVHRVEAVQGDHGYFSYYLYHLRTPSTMGFWRCGVVEYDIESVTVLDKLAEL